VRLGKFEDRGGAVLVLVLVLVGTNLATLAVLGWRYIRPRARPKPDPLVAASLDGMRPAASTSSVRRIITIEILNPIELAGTRGRLAGIAGSLAPGITRRIVYDQAIRNLQRQLVEEGVVADVRLHQIRPHDDGRSAAPAVDVIEVEPDPQRPLQP
jgi:hypothetical protein